MTAQKNNLTNPKANLCKLDGDGQPIRHRVGCKMMRLQYFTSPRWWAQSPKNRPNYCDCHSWQSHTQISHLEGDGVPRLTLSYDWIFRGGISGLSLMSVYV